MENGKFSNSSMQTDCALYSKLLQSRCSEESLQNGWSRWRPASSLRQIRAHPSSAGSLLFQERVTVTAAGRGCYSAWSLLLLHSEPQLVPGSLSSLVYELGCCLAKLWSGLWLMCVQCLAWCLVPGRCLLSLISQDIWVQGSSAPLNQP